MAKSHGETPCESDLAKAEALRAELAANKISYDEWLLKQRRLAENAKSARLVEGTSKVRGATCVHCIYHLFTTRSWHFIMQLVRSTFLVVCVCDVCVRARLVSYSYFPEMPDLLRTHFQKRGVQQDDLLEVRAILLLDLQPTNQRLRPLLEVRAVL